jgi:DNA-binding NarL/FixJ family response regulator
MVSWLDKRPMSHAGASRQEARWSAVLRDSEPIMLEILSRFLEPVGVAAISKQTTVAGALGAVRELRPDLLLLDLRDLEEVDSIGEARGLVPALKTIVLVDPGDESVLAAAYAAEATVVISRAASRDDLAAAVQQALEESHDGMYQAAG